MDLLKSDFDTLLEMELEAASKYKGRGDYKATIKSIDQEVRRKITYQVFTVRLTRKPVFKYLEPLNARKYNMVVPFFYVSRTGDREVQLITEDRRAGIFKPGEKICLEMPEDSTIGIQKMAVDFFCEGYADSMYSLGEALFHGKRAAPIKPKAVDCSLTPAQASAVGMVLGMEENQFCLIHGPPGTGKTTTIAEILRNTKGWRVLLTSHTNVAIDNAMEKIHQRAGVLRLGSTLKTSAKVHDLMPEQEDDKNYSEVVGRELKQCKVMGATLSKLGHMYLAGLLDWEVPFFDLAIIDEASMASFPLSLLGLLNARRAVLVGDHKQLEPILLSARDSAPFNARLNQFAKKSLFEMLMSRKANSVLLDTQFRSNKRIADFISSEFYEGKIKTHPSVADRKLSHTDNSDLGAVTSPDEPIVWVDTAGESSGNWRKYGTNYSYCNPHDAAVCAAVYYHFVSALKYKPEDMAVIAPYRLQTELIKETLREMFGVGSFDSIEFINSKTVHSFQGRQNKVVIYNPVLDRAFFRTRDRFKIFKPNLLNVAISRAESKLIVIGSKDIANERELPNIAHLYEYIKKNGKVFDSGPVAKDVPVDKAYRELLK
ncbi:MAG: AAA domain-containing protein [archaeon]